MVGDFETGRDLTRLIDEAELDGFEGLMTLEEEVGETETLDGDCFEGGAGGENVGGAGIVRRVTEEVEDA